MFLMRDHVYRTNWKAAREIISNSVARPGLLEWGAVVLPLPSFPSFPFPSSLPMLSLLSLPLPSLSLISSYIMSHPILTSPLPSPPLEVGP